MRLYSHVSQPFEGTAASPHALYLSVDGAAVLFSLVAGVPSVAQTVSKISRYLACNQ